MFMCWIILVLWDRWQIPLAAQNLKAALPRRIASMNHSQHLQIVTFPSSQTLLGRDNTSPVTCAGQTCAGQTTCIWKNIQIWQDPPRFMIHHTEMSCEHVRFTIFDSNLWFVITWVNVKFQRRQGPFCTKPGWWFQSLWKIWVSWDDYSKYMGK